MLQLDETAKGQLLAHIGKKAKVLWPVEDAPTTPVTGKAATKAAAFANRTVQDADVEGAACDGEMEQDVRESFWRL